MENISTVNDKLSELAAGSQEIVAKTLEVEELFEKIVGQMQEVAKE